MKIEYLPIDELTPYDRNARKHDVEDVEEIAKSIKAYGFNDPIGIWSNKNVIIEGHGRLQAAKKLGLETVPVIRLDHLTDDQRKAYAILHNKIAELSRWDFDRLNAEIEALEMKDFPDFYQNLDFEVTEDPEEEKESSEEETRMLTLSLSEEQYQIVLKVIDFIKENNIPLNHTWGNKNKKSNMIFEGVYLWAQRNSLT